MSRRKTETKQKHRSAAASPQKRERASQLFLAALTALFVATPLVPSETFAETRFGLLYVALWLLLLLGWLLHAVLQGRLQLHFGKSEWMVVLLVAWMGVSTLVMGSEGNARAAMNGFWRWASLGLAFLLTRQFARSASAAHAIGLVMAALAVGLSTYAFHQFFVTVPATQQMYAADPERLLRVAGHDPADEVTRRLFEDRIMSHEPTATFALTNSLAGFLAAWLTLLVGRVLWRPKQPHAFFAWATAIGCIVLIGGCLLLTKSRTGVLATGGGVGLLGFLWISTLSERKVSRRWLAASGAAMLAVCAVGIALAVAVGGVDLQVLTEAPKTLQYRLEYWKATTALIAEHPIFGAGPGNFQDYYITYQLPQASEAVADPHNMFFEVWATGGAPAFLFFLGFLYCVGRRWRFLGTAELPAKTESENDRTAGAGEQRAVYLGAVAGVLLSYPIGWLEGFTPEAFLFFISLPVGMGVVALLQAQSLNARTLVVSLAVAFVVLSINFLAAGGISFPGVVGSWWLLAAIALNLTDSPGAQIDLTPRRTLLGLAIVVVGIVLFYRTVFTPALTAPAILSDAQVAEQLGRPHDARAAYRRACSTDPWSAVYPAHLAHFAFRQWEQTQSEAEWAEFEQATALALSHNVHSRSLRKSVAESYLRAYSLRGGQSRLQQALKQYQELAKLAPNSSYSHAQLAWVLHIAGNDRQAASEAAESLRLDALNPHADKKLSLYQGPRPQWVSGPQEGGETLEQVMQRLRNTSY